MPIRVDFDEIERLRELRNIPSRSALARLAGLHEQHLYMIYAGTRIPHLNTLAKLCAVLHCEPGDILFYDPEGDEDIEQNGS